MGKLFGTTSQFYNKKRESSAIDKLMELYYFYMVTTPRGAR